MDRAQILTSSRGRWRRGLLNSSLALATIAIVLAFAEFLLRITGAVPLNGIHTVTESEFHAVPGMFSPNQSVVVRKHAELAHRVTINSLGFRGAEFPLIKPAGEVRILMIGDSFTFGDFVEDHETLPAQLERELKIVCRNIRVVNGGVGGTSIIDQIHIAGRGVEIAPDLVVLIFYENDVANLAGRALWDELSANREKKSRFPYSVIYRIMRSSALWNLLLRFRGSRKVGAERTIGTGNSRAASDTALLLRASYLEHLLRFRSLVESAGIPLVVTAFPAHLTVSGAGHSDQISWFADTASKLQLPYIDIASKLRQSGLSTNELYLLPHDGHASATGNGSAAKAMARAVAALSPLQAACSGR